MSEIIFVCCLDTCLDTYEISMNLDYHKCLKKLVQNSEYIDMLHTTLIEISGLVHWVHCTLECTPLVPCYCCNNSTGPVYSLKIIHRKHKRNLHISGGT